MSGGSMNYIYSNLEWAIPTDEKIDRDEYLEEEGKKLAKRCTAKLREAVIIAKELEWFLSGDTGTKSFRENLKAGLGYEL